MQILSVLNALKIKLNVKFACAKHFEQKMSKTLKTKGVKVELTGEQTEEIRKGFKIYDLENTNKIDVNDLKGALRACGFEPKKEEIKQIAKSLKSDEEGKITFEQFVGVISSRMTEKDTKEEIMKAFRLFDDDETGRISVTNLKRVAKELGETITDDELKVFDEMITEADINGDGEVDSEEFYKIMKKTSLY